MARVICQNCGAEVILPEHSTIEMGMTISQESVGNFVLPTRPTEQSFTSETNNTTNTNIQEENTMNELDMNTLARLVAEQIKANVTSAGTTTVDTTTTANTTQATVVPTVNGGKWAKTSKFYGKEICGIAYNPYTIRRWIQKQYEDLNRRYNFNITKAIRKDVKYMESIEYTMKEIQKMYMLEKQDPIAYAERSRFFTPDICKNILVEYCKSLVSYLRAITKNPTGKEDSVVHVNIKGYKYIEVGTVAYRVSKDRKSVEKYIKLSDDYKALMTLAKNQLEDAKRIYISSWSKSYEPLARFVKKMKLVVKIRGNISNYFMDAYVKSGAYYSCKNMIMFENASYEGLTGRDAVYALQNKLDNGDEGYKFHAVYKVMVANRNN